MKAAAGTMDGIIDTVLAWHPVAPLLQLLRPMEQLVVMGGPSRPLELLAAATSCPAGSASLGASSAASRTARPYWTSQGSTASVRRWRWCRWTASPRRSSGSRRTTCVAALSSTLPAAWALSSRPLAVIIN
jgi:hypothetical protein